METPVFNLPESLRAYASGQFVLLKPESIKKKRDALELRLSGYEDVAHLISDLVKTCILALGDGSPYSSAHIPMPESNVSGVLSIILDLIPYEEMNLLDQIRQEIINPQEEDWDFLLQQVTLKRNTLPVTEVE